MAQLLGLPKGVSEQIEKMIELFPGQPADEKTMKQLWEHVDHVDHVEHHSDLPCEWEQMPVELSPEEAGAASSSQPLDV